MDHKLLTSQYDIQTSETTYSKQIKLTTGQVQLRTKLYRSALGLINPLEEGFQNLSVDYITFWRHVVYYEMTIISCYKTARPTFAMLAH